MAKFTTCIRTDRDGIKMEVTFESAYKQIQDTYVQNDTYTDDAQIANELFSKGEAIWTKFATYQLICD